jgi:phytoene desaturase
MKKLIIIGAGISGLSTGVYGRLNGFDTEIYEMHNIPGGECTGWQRKDYYFDGCIHWLMGSKKGIPLNKVWREVGALDDNVEIINHDFFYCYEEDDKCIYLYRDVTKLKVHLMEIAPEDSDLITYMCKAINALKCVGIPTEKPLDKMNVLDIAKMVIEMIPAMKYMPKIDKMTIGEFADQFKSSALRNALKMLIPDHYKATALITTLASLADGDSGWPVGGSLALSKRVEAKYKSLGGKIFYKSKVKKILIEDGSAKGILLEDGTKHYADCVISTADGHATLFDMLDGKYLDDNLKTLYSDSKNYPVYTTVQVSIGVNCDLSKYPHTRFISMPSEIDGGGKNNKSFSFKHHCYDKTLMPEGKSSLITMLQADFDWWKDKYSNIEEYKREKERIAKEIKAIAEKYYPEIIDKIEIIDVATPMTYVRYCNAWEGAWMAWATTPGGKIRYVPGNLPGLNNFYLSGQWTLPPGGLPTAVVTGRWVIQRICSFEKRKFITG